MRSPALQTVIDFCLENAFKAPLSKRASLYRGIAEICCDPTKTAELCNLATELETAEKHSRELAFKFLEEGK